MTTNALAPVQNRAAAALIAAAGFNREEIELIKSTVAVGATDMELALFLRTAKHRGLDPFAKQLHFVKRRVNRQDPVTGEWRSEQVGTMQTGIDGFRLIAERSAKSDGQDEPEYAYNPDGSLLKATVRAYRVGVPRPFVGLAFWNEYCDFDKNGKPRQMWLRMPHTMLAKCAEAQALRKAFPEDLSGLYTDDEMQQADALPAAPATGKATGTVTRIDRSQPGAGDSEQTIEQVQDDFAEATRKAEELILARITKRDVPAAAIAEILATIAPGLVEWRALSLEQKRVFYKELKERFPIRRPPSGTDSAGGAPVPAAEAQAPAPAVAATSGPEAPAAASPAPAGLAATATPARESETWTLARFAELGIEDDNEDLLELTGTISLDVDGAVDYEWRRLSTTAQRELVRALQDRLGASDP